MAAKPKSPPLRLLVAQVAGGRKAVSSTHGMQQNAATSPFFPAWIERCRLDVEACQRAVAERDFFALAEVVEGNALAMHATMLAGRPGLIYWQPATIAILHAVRQLRRDGAECCFTIDAGASVVILCGAHDVRAVADTLAEIDGIEQVLQTRVGPGARLVDA